MSGLPINRAKLAAFTLGRLLRRLRRALPRASRPARGNADLPQAGAYTLNSIAAVVLGGTSLLGGVGRRHRRADRRADPARHLASTSAFSRSTRCCSRWSRASCCSPRSASAPSACCASRTASNCSGRTDHGQRPSTLPRLKPDDVPIVIAAGFILVILAAGTVYTLATQGTAPLLSPNYLLQQLQIGAFLGIVAAGMMMVILLGHIDLSVPWTMTAAAMMATTVGGARGHPDRPRRRPRGRPLQRPRRRLPAHPVDDLHPRRQRGDARPDGRPHRRLRAADRGDRR